MASRKRHTKQKNQSISILFKARQSPEQIKDYFPNIDFIYPGGRTLLTLAIENGEDISLVEAIIKSGADVNVKNSKGQTALMFAARAQRNDVLQKLLENEAQVDLLNDKNLTALSICIAENNIDGVKHLVQSGADVNLKTGKLQETALAQAKRLGSIHVMDLLERNSSSLDGISPLSGGQITKAKNTQMSEINTEKLRHSLTKFYNLKYSKDNGQIISFKSFRKLADVFQKNGRLNCQDSSGATLLMYAAMQTSRESLEYILNLNPDVTIRDCDGRTALMYVFISGMNISKLSLNQLIMKYPHGQDKYGKTVFMIALENSVNLPLQFCNDLSRLDDIRTKDVYGRTSLMYAIEHCHSNELIAYILSLGSDVGVQDKDGVTALIIAFKKSLKLWCSILTKLASKNINKQDCLGSTALMYAAKYKASEDYLRILMKCGADVNIPNVFGLTPLSYLIKGNSVECGCNGDRYEFSFYFRNTLKCRYECLRTVLDNSFCKKLSSRNRQIIFEYLESHQMDSLNWFYSKDKTFLRALWRNGIYVQPKVVNGSKFRGTSPLLVALELGHLDMVSFITDNYYMTNRDFRFLRKFYDETSWMTRRCHSSLNISRDAIQFAEKAVSQPWPLVKLSFIAVSTCIGLYGDRAERVAKLPIPQILKNNLLLQCPEAAIQLKKAERGQELIGTTWWPERYLGI
ncbi:ankyrin repeat protein isoform X2 [Biomphalaria pfeifferi]|uniref:Ankyrin repeat protein isoform X2 n=1 Tax=Biomphalaria pfeifferi TaxID=112525 RepID=A0AAD8FLK2_BIOPF|nr:ankyrin repeat protein isoform X2 [Biomphalaria pfeifferi]